jgi:hypothetical protein
MNTEIKEDFGTVYLETNINKEEFNYHKAIKSIMESNGYPTETCDICSIETEWNKEEVDIKFKFVHYSVKTMETKPFFKIKFKEA